MTAAVDGGSTRRDLVLLAVGLGLLLAWDAAGQDLPVSRLFADAGGFPWRDRWLTSRLLHDGARWLAWAAGALVLLDVWRPLPFARRLGRDERVAWAAATAACLLFVPALKAFSATSCPWSLAEFGGTAHYVSHWAFGQRDGGDGRCFPAGHATAAFAFLPGYFALRGSEPAAAQRWLAVVVAAGVVVAATQLVRGAHYVSHSLWTAWLCWALGLAVFAAVRRGFAWRQHRRLAATG